MSDCAVHVIRPKASKHHICFHCHTTIVKGTVYARGKGQWEGEWQDWKMHTDCEAIAQMLSEGEAFCASVAHERGKGCPDCDPGMPFPASKIGKGAQP